MITTFDNLLITVNRYGFDIITMSEIWLKENNLLLQHVSIPGYVQAFNNRTTIRGGGVGVYLKESVNFKRRADLEKKYPGMEHLWLEISCRNRHSRLLLGTIYRSERIMGYNDWLENFESLMSELTITWDGMLLITGDFNIDLLRKDKLQVQGLKTIDHCIGTSTLYAFFVCYFISTRM
jgi:exonuclease III